MSENYSVLDDKYRDTHNNIRHLIANTISNMHTIYLAQVVSVHENKVSIKNVMLPSNDAQALIVPNILVGQACGGGFYITHSINEGDIGIALVCKNDISTYKYTGQPGVVGTERKFNINDSIFIPLSLYEQGDLAPSELVISNKSKQVNIKLTNDEISIQAPKVNIKTSGGSYKDAIMKILDICHILRDSLQGSGTNPAQYNARAPAIEAQIKSILD